MRALSAQFKKTQATMRGEGYPSPYFYDAGAITYDKSIIKTANFKTGQSGCAQIAVTTAGAGGAVMTIIKNPLVTALHNKRIFYRKF